VRVQALDELLRVKEMIARIERVPADVEIEIVGRVVREGVVIVCRVIRNAGFDRQCRWVVIQFVS
jgi:hypothetical protein